MAKESYLSIITLNVNGLNAPTKRQRQAEWVKKQDPYIRDLKPRGTYRLKVKAGKRYFIQMETKRKPEQKSSYQKNRP